MPDTQSHKQCSKCKEIKPLSSYYHHPTTRDHLFNSCKTCWAERARLWRSTESARTIVRKAQARFRKTERGKENNRLGSKAYQKRNPIKYRTRMAMAHAVRMGLIHRPDSCSKCGVTCKPEAHHHRGYSAEHRFDVIWLCKLCHHATHVDTKTLLDSK